MATPYEILKAEVNFATVALVLTAAANASGGSTVYTGTITGGGSNAFAGVTFVIAGFTNAGNNGTFVCTASSTTTLTLTNSGGVAETHAGTATGANNVIVTGVAGKQIYVRSINLIINNAQILTFLTGTTALAPTHGFNFSAAAQWIQVLRGYRDAYFITNAGDNLAIASTTTAQVSGFIEYSQS